VDVDVCVCASPYVACSSRRTICLIASWQWRAPKPATRALDCPLSQVGHEPCHQHTHLDSRGSDLPWIRTQVCFCGAVRRTHSRLACCTLVVGSKALSGGSDAVTLTIRLHLRLRMISVPPPSAEPCPLSSR
jgi:hypothetical protein